MTRKIHYKTRKGKFRRAATISGFSPPAYAGDCDLEEVHVESEPDERGANESGEEELPRVKVDDTEL